MAPVGDVRLLPNHWCASSCTTSRSWVRRPSTWFAPKIDMPCASIGIVQLVVGDHDAVVARTGTGPKSRSKRRHDRGLPAEVVRGAAAQPGRDRGRCGTGPRPGRLARTVRSGRSPGSGAVGSGARRPRSGAGRAAPRETSRRLASDRVRRRGGHRDPVASPCRAGWSLHGNQDGAPIGWLATSAPSVSSSQPTSPQRLRTGRGLPRVAHLDRERGPAAPAAPGVTCSLPPRAGVTRGRPPVDQHLVDPEAGAGRG